MDLTTKDYRTVHQFPFVDVLTFIDGSYLFTEAAAAAILELCFPMGRSLTVRAHKFGLELTWDWGTTRPMRLIRLADIPADFVPGTLLPHLLYNPDHPITEQQRDCLLLWEAGGNESVPTLENLVATNRLTNEQLLASASQRLGVGNEILWARVTPESILTSMEKAAKHKLNTLRTAAEWVELEKNIRQSSTTADKAEARLQDIRDTEATIRRKWEPYLSIRSAWEQFKCNTEA